MKFTTKLATLSMGIALVSGAVIAYFGNKLTVGILEDQIKKITVLVVDDDRRMVKTICDILKVKGFDAPLKLQSLLNGPFPVKGR